MNYNYVSGNTGHHVVETATGHVLKTEMEREEARALARRLNLGGGFDGNTPSFFCAKFSAGAFIDTE